jgi:hypothetical protein
MAGYGTDEAMKTYWDAAGYTYVSDDPFGAGQHLFRRHLMSAVSPAPRQAEPLRNGNSSQWQAPVGLNQIMDVSPCLAVVGPNVAELERDLDTRTKLGAPGNALGSFRDLTHLDFSLSSLRV